MKFGVTRKTLILLFCGSAVALAGWAWGLSVLFLVIYDAAVASLFIADILLAARSGNLSAKRVFSDAELSHEGRVTLIIKNHTNRDLYVRAADTLPAELKGVISDAARRLPAGGETRLDYSFSPAKRGSFDFGKIYLMVRGPLGLGLKRVGLPCPDSVRVLPNLDPMRKYRLLADKRQLFRQDSSIHVMRGAGSEFSSLREYFTGDDYRSINWKASARMNKLMSNTYDVEKDRTVIVAIDAGRGMAPGAGGMTRLDHAVESAVALAAAATASGDRVGLAVFSNKVKLWLPPQKGRAQIKRILDAAYSAQPDSFESDHEELLSFLSSKQRRRCLISVFTHINSESEACETAGIYERLSKNNMVIIASLKSPGLDELASAPADTDSDVYVKAAAVYRSEIRRRSAAALTRSGIFGVLAAPEILLSEVVNRYVMIKKRL